MSVAPDRAVCSTCGRVFTEGERFCPFDRTDLNPSPASHTDPLVGTVLSGSYTLLSKLGGGGMGVVYRARQNRLQRDIAVKILSPQLGSDEHARERFRIEALAVSQLSSPHTVAIHDFGSTAEGLLYIVMQLVEGESLRAWLTRGPLSLRAAVAVAAQVFDSLGEAHDRKPQIVHRDIKPDNIIVRTLPDGEPFVTVLDFGLAKLADGDKLTASGLIVGTPAYMAPEQARTDGPLDARVDLYAGGVVLHEMISGRQPFTAPNPTALLYKHVWEAPPSLSSVCPGLWIPAELERLVLELLAKNPDDRPASASVARARLLEILKQLPEQSAPAPTLVPTAQSMISPDRSAPVSPRPRLSPAPESKPVPTLGLDDSVPPPEPPTDPSSSFTMPPARRIPWVWVWVGGALALVAGLWFALGRGRSEGPVAPAAITAPVAAARPIATPVKIPAPAPAMAVLPAAAKPAPPPPAIETPPRVSPPAHHERSHRHKSGGGADQPADQFPVVPE